MPSSTVASSGSPASGGWPGLWETLNAQMGAVMRSSMENQHIDLDEAARRHREVADVFRTGDRVAMTAALYDHYLTLPT